MTSESEITRRLAAAIPRITEQPGTLAALRRAAGRPPLDLPETWPLIVPIAHDAPWAEAAVHHALTLYAVHQQSLVEPMHRAGSGVGRASRALRERTDSDGARRRLLAVASAQSVSALAAQLRGLVTLLRSERIPLDYVGLARDLLAWPDPARAANVRRRWARDFYGVEAAEDAANTSPPEPAITSPPDSDSIPQTTGADQ